jgi:hypothetical protein
MTSPGRRSLLPSRRDTRKRHSLFLQIKNSSKRETPLRALRFRVTRETEGSPRLGSGPRTPGLFPRFKFTANMRAFSRAIRQRAHLGARPDRPRVNIPSPAIPLSNAGLAAYNAGKYVPPSTYPLAALIRSESRHRLSPIEESPVPDLNSSNVDPAQPHKSASHFSRIGVLSAQQSKGTVSSHLRLKYRTCSRPEAQMP